ncbi:MAG: imidazole glycerol phosphate synthase subunit HisH [Permianibacter sp.]
MITIVDYGLGNIQAFANVYKRANIECRTARTAEELNGAKRIVLPGVGAFDYAMARLNASGMRDVLDDLVIKKGVPVVGICVGMQILAESSDEGVSAGLGWIPGKVRKFDVSQFRHSTHLPHMGWNDVVPGRPSRLFAGLESDARFYFLHSYYFDPKDQSHSLATSEYGIRFSSAVNLNNIYGVQFHPEKSHHYGIQLLTNFAEV